MKKFKVKKEEGITLVALVVTIVVLLILAGISLNLVLGQNGIITKAKEAREKSDEATTNTELFFNSTVDEIDKAIGEKKTSTEIVTEEEFRKNPTNYKHEDQKESDNVGIGTDGKPVNMDLWSYRIWWDDTVCLSNIQGSYLGGPGYQNENITAEGTIQGTVPKIIYDSQTGKVLPVTSMQGTFYNCTNLVTPPEIPDTVTDMIRTFYGCTSLTTAPEVISENIEEMEKTFYRCINLTGTITINAKLGSYSYPKDGCFSGTVKPIVIRGLSPYLAELAATAENGNVTVEQ